MLSTLLVLLWMSRYWCAAPKISLVNEVLVGLEWRDLIGQQRQASGPVPIPYRLEESP